MSGEFTFVDLFAGIGGFRLALESVGGKCIGFSEIAKDAIHTYCANFRENEKCNLGDITKLEALPEHDFMTAGVPCQSWSIAGKNLGFDDDRGQLWNDTLYLLNEVRPKAFIFENVKGLADPRNKDALDYILRRIKEAGYHAQKFVINAYDYGVPQTRIRIYIIGFREELYFRRFRLPPKCPGLVQVGDVLDGLEHFKRNDSARKPKSTSLSCNAQGFNDYFLFNDLRGGDTTIHSWDIKETTERQKYICNLLLRNRRKPYYGPLDGNPLSLAHFQALDESITQEDLDSLVNIGILKRVSYLYEVAQSSETSEKFNTFDSSLSPRMTEKYSESEKFVLSAAKGKTINFDVIKNDRELKKRKIDVPKTLKQLEEKGILKCVEMRYDFKNTKISTGLDGVNRIFLPSSKIYPTLVASDTNDFVTAVNIEAESIGAFREKFLREVYFPRKFRKITKAEACRIQGFPGDFKLPESRPRWMHLIGNSVAVPVIRQLAQAVVDTGVFGGEYVEKKSKLICRPAFQADLFSEYAEVINVS